MNSAHIPRRLQACPMASLPWRGLLAGLLALALVAAACGGDSQDTTAGSQPTAPEPAVEEPEPEVDESGEGDGSGEPDGSGESGEGDGSDEPDGSDDRSGLQAVPSMG